MPNQIEKRETAGSAPITAASPNGGAAPAASTSASLQPATAQSAQSDGKAGVRDGRIDGAAGRKDGTASPSATRAIANTANVAAIANLDSPELYLNRELTWLAFNRRVVGEAEDENNPLLERLKFLAITARNLDEFFMKRIGGLKQQVVAGVHELTVDGRTPQQQIAECYAQVREIEQQQREVLPVLLGLLKAHGIEIAGYEQLSSEEQATLREYYLTNIFPLVTPQAMDPAHPFPFVSNLSLNLLVTLRRGDDSEPSLARVKVPLGFGIPRFLRVGKGNRFVPLEDVMAHNLDLLFPGMSVISCEFFRVTRNANTERDEEEADDLLAMIETELRDRRFAPIVRLEVARGMDPMHRGMLAAELGLDERDDVFETDGMLAMRDLMELAALDDPALHDPPHHPIDHPRLPQPRNIFHIIRDAGSILLLHPYESFSTSVERFLREASDRPEGARDQDDALPHLGRLRHDRLSVRRGAQRQAGRGGGGAQGALRRGGQHPLRGPARGVRHPRHLRRGRAQDPLQGDSGGAPGLQRTAPLRAYRHRQLPSRHRAHLRRLRPAHLRRDDRAAT